MSGAESCEAMQHVLQSFVHKLTALVTRDTGYSIDMSHWQAIAAHLASAASGSFSGIDVKCMPVFCGEAPEPSHTSNEKNKRCFSLEEVAYTCHEGYTVDGTPHGRTSVPPVLPVDCAVPARRNHSTVDPTAKVYNEREGRLSVRCRVPRGSTVAVQAQVQHGSRCGR